MKLLMARSQVVFNFKNWFKTVNEQDLVEQYLADSASLADVERRQRLISRGEAPWQISAKQRLGSWS
jgi:hypothetical protein